ncbi:polyadenylate binding protein [Salpingoeca rosetta]|uniref:Polyadenylate binding protein n=1 Tax=Salpingoeca rosetta (strain ATCC 50818 / BSB-021) TaxID=946362 RepID=F2TXY3_SALR5|nr:polyadenylate binding protein [Salpingoeca rosetta]EGD76242.1 polyadenylate binding protein [Salpingoeca rosetta]|eukprot:XP_004998417.1 polyadenylate binding protein [Salpingoeca rosetta]
MASQTEAAAAQQQPAQAQAQATQQQPAQAQAQPQFVAAQQQGEGAVGATTAAAPMQQQPQQAFPGVAGPVPANPQGAAASLYVGDLSPQVNETELFNLFSSIGSVMSVRVCRDQITRSSLGYGYVNFNKAEDAEAAMGQLNFHDLHGRHIRIMKVERDPKKRRSGVGNIFISGLPADTTSVHLRDTFEQFGKILSCKAVLDHSGRCRGFGFVHFEDPKVAERAIAEANGKDAGGDRKLRVAPFKPRKQREQEQEERTKNFTNVYVKSLRRDADEEELGKLFEPYGDITSKALRTYKLKDTERPYGFVNFADTEAAQKCVEEGEMHQRDIFYVDGMAFEEGKKVEDFVKTVEECAGSEVERHHLQVADGKLSGFILFKEHGEETVDKAMTGLPEKMEAATDHISKAKLYVQRAQKKQERIRRLRRRLQERRRELRQRGGNLFVKNFNENVTEEDLRKFFEECGHVMSVKVMRDKEGVSRCFGFVTFATREEAESAIAKKNRQPLQDRPIYVAFHLTRQERQARKQQQHPQHPQQGMYMYPQYPGMPMGAFGPGYYNPQMMMVNPQMPRAMNFPAQAGNRGGPVGGPNRYMQQQNRPMPPQAQQQMARNPQQFRQQFAGQQQMPPQQQMQQMQQEAPQGQQQQQQAQQQMQLPQDVTSQLAHMDEEQRRRYLGDMLYHRVANIDKERAPKITGMLLAYDAGHLMNLLASDAALREQVMLAQNILTGNAAAPANQQQQGNQQQQQPAQQPAQQANQQAPQQQAAQAAQ